MERSEIRGPARNPTVPDYATLHPGYSLLSEPQAPAGAGPQFREFRARPLLQQSGSCFGSATTHRAHRLREVSKQGGLAKRNPPIVLFAGVADYAANPPYALAQIAAKTLDAFAG